jgi:hypothetical protein
MQYQTNSMKKKQHKFAKHKIMQTNPMQPYPPQYHGPGIDKVAQQGNIADFVNCFVD